MVRKKILISIFISANSLLAYSQGIDTLDCNAYFKDYEDLMSGKAFEGTAYEGVMLTLWSDAPVLLDASKPVVTRMEKLLQSNSVNDCVIISVIIDEKGIPCCFKVESPLALTEELKWELIREMHNLRFSPAKVGNRFSTSIYSIPLQKYNFGNHSE